MSEGDTNNPWGDQAPPPDPWAHPEAPKPETRWNTPPAPTTAPVAPPSAAPASSTPPKTQTTPPPPPAQATPPPAPVAPPPVVTIAPPTAPTPSVGTPTAPPPPGTSVVGSPVFGGDYGADDLPVAPDAPSGSGRAPWLLAIVAALTLLGGAGFFALSAFGAQGGAETPEAAVDALITSLNNEDFITMGEMIDPAERRTIVEPVITDVLPELIRIGVFSPDLDAAQVKGVDFNLTNVTYEVDPLDGHPDVRLVWFTGGESTSTFTALDFPLGDALREFAGDDLEDDQQTTQMADDEVPMVLVERDGRWFVSMWHTVAETARIEAGEPVPRAAARPLALGSESPEAAVEAMINELTDLDLEGLIGRLDPEEMDALYRYSPLFLDEAQQELDSLNEQAAEEGVTWAITGLEFDVESSGDDAVVSILSGTLVVESPDVQMQLEFTQERISASINGEIDGQPFEGSLVLTPEQWRASGEFDGEIVDLEINFNHDTKYITMSGRGFDEQLEGSIDLSDEDCGKYDIIISGEIESGCLTENGESVQSFVTVMEQLEEGFGSMSMKTRRTEGEWYVSPIGTSMDGMISWLRNIEDDGFEQLLDSADLASSPLDLATGDVFPSIDSDDGFIEPDFGPVIEPGDFPGTERVDFVIDPPSDPALFVDVLPALGEHGYSVPLTAGQVMGITVDGVDGGVDDPQVRIDGPSGSLAWADDEDGLNAALVFVAPEDGTYDIVVSAWDADGGTYELGVHVVAPGGAPAIGSVDVDGTLPTEIPEGTDTTLDLSTGGVVHRGDLTNGASDTFQIEVTAGSEWVISYEADPDASFDPVLAVMDETSLIIVENDDAVDVGLGSSFDSQVVFVAPADGSYVIDARAFGFSGSGGYTLTITPAG